MKKAILILSILLAILLIVAAILFFTDVLPSRSSEPTQAPTETAQPTEQTQAVTEPETTEEIVTEPQIEIAPDDRQTVLNGVQVECFFADGVRSITAKTLAAALGLDAGSGETQQIFGRDSVAFAESGVVINGTRVDGVEAPASGGTDGVLTSDGEDYEGLPVDLDLYLPFDGVIAALDCPEYIDEDTGVHYYTPSARRFEIPQGVNVPVLMYHAVSDDMWGINELFVSPSSMEEQLAYLVENDYDAIWFEDLAHLEDYEKPVILTFDDGYDDNYLYLFPLLQKYQVKATVFVIGNAPGTSHKATEEQIREMSDSGLVSIQSHSYTHTDMDTLGYESTEYEMAESKKVITRITGKEPYVLCYPTGRYNSYTLELGPEYYMFGIKMNGGLYNTSDDPFLVNRYYVSRYTDLYGFASYLSAAGT